MLNKNSFITWLRNRGFTPVEGKPDTFEKDGWRYTAKMQSFEVRNQLSANRWSGAESFRYNRRFINSAGKLDWK